MASITLPARCDRAAAEALLPELRAAIGSGPIAIDGRAVSQVGEAVLQLLLAARRSGDGAVIEPSPALIEAARLAGVDAHLFEGTAA